MASYGYPPCSVFSVHKGNYNALYNLTLYQVCKFNLSITNHVSNMIRSGFEFES